MNNQYLLDDAEVKVCFNPCPKHGEPAPTYAASICQAQLLSPKTAEYFKRLGWVPPIRRAARPKRMEA